MKLTLGDYIERDMGMVGGNSKRDGEYYAK